MITFSKIPDSTITALMTLLIFLAMAGNEAKAGNPPDESAGIPQETILQGEQKVFPKSNSIWVENGQIIKVEEATRGTIVRALRPGSSELKLSGRSILFNVLSLEQERTRRMLLKLLPQTLGLHLRVHDGVIAVEGHLRRWRDWELLAGRCSLMRCQYQMQASIGDSLWSEAELKINRILNAHALPEQKLEKTNPPTLHLPSKSMIAKDLEAALAPYGIMIARDSNSIELAPLVKVQITVAEVKKDHLLQYGLKWPSSYQAQILPTPSGITDPQFLTAEFWEHSGAGHILASPNLLCRSGKEAEFLAGGEFPIKMINFRVEDVIWKKYGIVLKVAPIADFSGRMSIALETEVSSIDPSRTVDGIPGLFTNRVQSYFDLARPRTIALSGLIKSEDSRASEGLPFLHNIPILGSLFGSKDFQENRTELVIFVRPEVINPDSPSDEMKLPQWEEAAL